MSPGELHNMVNLRLPVPTQMPPAQALSIGQITPTQERSALGETEGALVLGELDGLTVGAWG